MSWFALNLVLALIWGALVGFGAGALLAGFALGFLVLAAGRPFLGCRRYVRAVRGSVRLVGFFLKSLVAGSLQLAWAVLRPRLRFRPAFVRIDARGLGVGHTVLFAQLLSLTPGSLTVDIEPDGAAIYVHALFAEEKELARRQLRAMAAVIQAAAGETASGAEGPWSH